MDQPLVDQVRSFNRVVTRRSAPSRISTSGGTVRSGQDRVLWEIETEGAKSGRCGLALVSSRPHQRGCCGSPRSLDLIAVEPCESRPPCPDRAPDTDSHASEPC